MVVRLEAGPEAVGQKEARTEEVQDVLDVLVEVGWG